jgi:GST-like protein
MVTDTSTSPGTGAAWRVLGTKGCGSAIVEAALAVAGLPYEREELDYASPAGRARLAEVNPLAQVPAVVLPDGRVMTETAAIVQHVAELVPAAGLLPAVGDPLRPVALRWLVFLVAAIYPTFTYGDDPARWGCGDALREAPDRHRERLWRQLESEVRGPWLLGPACTALDLYVAVMVQWRPGRAWFAGACPRLAAIATALGGDPRLAAVWRANFA